jgi:SAM-dependent methyltransferase
MGILRRFLDGQKKLSRAFDARLPADWRRVGIFDFEHSLVPSHLKPGQRIYDLGGGKRPCLEPAEKRRLGARVTGLDIDAGELARAPEGAYDTVVRADLATWRGSGDADLVLCRALLEHVRDIEGAFAAMASTLRPGGRALVFVPSRNAVFARLNLLLPEALKRLALRLAYPGSLERQGFPSYYARCTPAGFRKLAEKNDLAVIEERHYFISGYFYPFFPAHLLWRSWMFLFRALRKGEAAETFAMVLEKRGNP